MRFDTTDFPIVQMQYDQVGVDGDDAGLEAFIGLLDRGQPFVVIGVSLLGGSHSHEHEEQKSTVLWIKQNRARLRELVKAMILIEPNTAKRLAAKAGAAVFGRVWSFPMLFAPSPQEALETASRLLAGEDERSSAG